MPDYIFTVRNQNRDGSFGSDVGKTSYLVVADATADLKVADKRNAKAWIEGIVSDKPGDILIYIHGFNEATTDILKNHRSLKESIASVNSSFATAYNIKLVSFDWPCGDSALMYLDDRQKARKTALELVNGGIVPLSLQQQAGCRINIHLLAHSAGAFVVREAFDDADDHSRLSRDWIVNQLMFIAGDISSSSMNMPGGCDSLYEHTVRFTNYYNPFDNALAMSNLKRLGFENRVGRVGLPGGAPSKAVDINCGSYYQAIQTASEQPFFSHGWYFDTDVNGGFIKDMMDTIEGAVDRSSMPTRQMVKGKLELRPFGK